MGWLVLAMRFNVTLLETHSSHGLEPKVVSMYCFNLVVLGISSVAIHNKCNVLRNGTLL